MNLPAAHIDRLQELGYTDSEAKFLYIVAVFSGYFGAFVREPVTRDGKAAYLAHGKVDFFGDEAMARTGGADGQNSTLSDPIFPFKIPFAA